MRQNSPSADMSQWADTGKHLAATLPQLPAAAAAAGRSQSLHSQKIPVWGSHAVGPLGHPELRKSTPTSTHTQRIRDHQASRHHAFAPGIKQAAVFTSFFMFLSAKNKQCKTNCKMALRAFIYCAMMYFSCRPGAIKKAVSRRQAIVLRCCIQSQQDRHIHGEDMATFQVFTPEAHQQISKP